MQNNSNQKILVGLSGGVDSAVAAILLKKQGYSVSGATMTIWGNRKVEAKAFTKEKSCKDACFSPNEEEDVKSAQKIAEAIGIPYHVIDCSNEYEDIVLKYFKDEYLNGRTPNPCVRCNAFVKFGVLPKIAKLKGIEFDKFATGHYARVEKTNGYYILKQAANKSKDQSYFLYRLKQEQLENILLPLGEYEKSQIRQIARDNGLEVSDKPDSQDFYDGDYNELLGVKELEGNIVDVEGKILGTHKGIWNYTIGQRKGIGIAASEPLYVLALNKEKNEVVVGSADKTFKKSLIALDVSYPSPLRFSSDKKYFAKIRSSQKPQVVSVIGSEDRLEVVFDEYQKSIAPGQSVVIYDDETLVAGGVIDSVQ